MKNRLLVLISFLSLSVVQEPAFGWATSEGSAFSKGDLIGSAGFSLVHLGLVAGVDYGLHDCISAGVAAGYTNHSEAPQLKTHQVPIMARVGFHPFNLKVIADNIIIRNKVDVYAGISTGWTFLWHTGIAAPDEHPGFRIREYIGMRFFFNDKIALYVEDNGPLSTIGLGIAYTF